MTSIRCLSIRVKPNQARLGLESVLSYAIGPAHFGLEHFPPDRNLWVVCILDRTILADDIEAVSPRSQLEFVAV
jgi:hypothetical protein